MPAFSLVSEKSDTCVIATRLREQGVVFFHVPNEGRRSKQEAAILARMGVSAGVPDLIILDKPPNNLSYVGAAIEVKRILNGKTSEKQSDWLILFAERGWATAVCYGSRAAFVKLREWGYLPA
jgi:hypothetical protein